MTTLIEENLSKIRYKIREFQIFFKEWYSSQRIYFIERWEYALARFLLICIFVSLMIWVVSKKGWDKLGPLIILFGFLIAYLVRKGFFKDIYDSLGKYTYLPIEKYEDPSTEPWKKTNHSFHEIKWNPETNEKHIKSLSEFWKKQCAWRISYYLLKPSLYECLREDTGTINYRILSLCKALFLRIHKHPNKEDLVSKTYC